MAISTSGPQPYNNQPMPANDASRWLWAQNEFRSASVATQTLEDALSGLTGDLRGGNVSLGSTGVKPGTYKLATVRVGADGRIIAITEGDAAKALPQTAVPGQVLVSTRTGAQWVSASTLVTSSPPAYSGGGGSTFVGVTSVALASSRDLAITGSPITKTGTITLDLKPTGVSAGTYTNSTITVDAQGRITAASSTEVQTQNTPLPYLTMIDQGDGVTEYRVAIINGAWSITTADQITAEDGSGPIMTEDGSGAIGAE